MSAEETPDLSLTTHADPAPLTAASGAAVQLLATCWTSAGDTAPDREDQTSPVPLAERVDALRAAGFTGMDLVVDDLRALERTAEGLEGLALHLFASGVRHAQLELLGGWWEGPSADRDLLLTAAERCAEAGLEVQVKASPDLSAHPVDPSATKDAWGALADQCADVGASLVLEPVAFGQLAPSADRGPSVEQGAAFVQAVGHPNGGLLVDVHQAVRGGSTWASLAHAIDPAYLRAVELSDGPVQPPSDLSVPEEAMHARSLPGQGEWDLAGFVATMRERGFTGPWAVEMCSPSFRALPVREALRRAAGATLSVL